MFLDVASGIGLVAFFIIMSSGLAASVGAAARLPLRVRHFIGVGVAGEGVAPAGFAWLAAVFFGACAFAVAFAEVRDLLTVEDSRRAFIVWAELAIEVGWILYLVTRSPAKPPGQTRP